MPPIAFLEPTTGQDHPPIDRDNGFLRRLKREHDHTVIIITHDMEIVARYAERVTGMGGGTIFGDGPPGRIFSDRSVLAPTSLQPPQVTRLAHRVADLGFPSGILSNQEMLEEFDRLTAAGPRV